MARRNYLPPESLVLRDAPSARAPVRGHPVLIEDPTVLHRVHPFTPSSAVRLHPALVEDHIASQQRNMQPLLRDNQRLGATHVALRQELAAAQQELRQLSTAAADIQAEREAQVRELHQRARQMEAEFRSADSLKDELTQVRGDIEQLASARLELTAKLKAMDGDILQAHSELHHFPEIKAEVEAMHREIQRGRDAIEHERKVQATHHEQGLVMEKSMVSVAQEIEKLRAELADAEKRARAAAAAAAAATPSPGFAAGYGNHEIGYGGSFYSDPYATHQIQGNVDGGHPYGSVTSAHGPYDLQQTQGQ